MDFSSIINGIVDSQIQNEYASKPILSLGELILLLRLQPQTNAIKIDYGGNPGSLDSYRGYYKDLAISPDGDTEKTVAAFLSDCENSVGKTYDGYKGGEFTMTKQTFMWVACYGTTGKMLTGVESKGKSTVLVTMDDAD